MEGSAIVTPKGNFVGIILDVEGRPSVTAPRSDQVVAAIRELTPNGGPGFLILSKPGKDYIQAAGGNNAFVVEWRQYDERSFHHWVAGDARQSAEGLVHIATNGAYVTVQRNEQLRVDDVEVLTTAFLNGYGRPSRYAWREKDF